MFSHLLYLFEFGNNLNSIQLGGFYQPHLAVNK